MLVKGVIYGAAIALVLLIDCAIQGAGAHLLIAAMIILALSLAVWAPAEESEAGWG